MIVIIVFVILIMIVIIIIIILIVIITIDILVIIVIVFIIIIIIVTFVLITDTTETRSLWHFLFRLGSSEADTTRETSHCDPYSLAEIFLLLWDMYQVSITSKETQLFPLNCAIHPC